MLTEFSVVTLVYIAIPVVTALVALGLVAWIYRTAWDRRGSRVFVAMLLVQQVWMVALVVHIALADPTTQRIVLGFESLAAHTTIALFVVFVSVYTGVRFHRRLPFAVAIAAYPITFLVLAVTNGATGLLYERLPVHSDPFHYVGPVVGPGYGVLIALGIPLVGYSAFVIYRYLDRTQLYSDLQAVLLLLAMIPIGLMELLGILGVFPALYLHHAAYGVLSFNLLATIALFWLGLFDVQPVARARVLEDLEDPIVIVDQAGILVDCNEAAVQSLPALDEATGEDLASAVPALATALEATSATNVSVERGAETRHFSVTTSAIRDSWTAVVLRDVTELERQNERLDQVATTISHDLRNPIQIAEGYADLLEVDDDSTAHLAEITGALERMEAIIDDVLALARHGASVVDPEPVSIATVAREAWSNVETHEATLVVEADRTIEADRDRLLTIFENLLRNAIDHGGPDVTVEVGATEAGFYLEDDGPGIPAEEAGEVFSYGYTTHEEGTGLGLSIVETIAETHGWHVRVGDEGTGARFEFTTEGAVAVPERSPVE